MTGMEQPASRVLLSEADFWTRVQEPTTRERDEARLVELADEAIAAFRDRPLVQAAATIVLAYRAIADGSPLAPRREALIERCRVNLEGLDWSSGFQPCRWWLSTRLALAALLIAERRLDEAAAALEIAQDVADEAFRHGQLTTNVVKCALLRVVLAAEGSAVDADGLRLGVDRLLSDARIVAVNYRFTNQYAYEEVAYVFTMLRQLYNWRRLSGTTANARELRRAGVEWTIVGAPFDHMLWSLT